MQHCSAASYIMGDVICHRMYGEMWHHYILGINMRCASESRIQGGHCCPVRLNSVFNLSQLYFGVFLHCTMFKTPIICCVFISHVVLPVFGCIKYFTKATWPQSTKFWIMPTSCLHWKSIKAEPNTIFHDNFGIPGWAQRLRSACEGLNHLAEVDFSDQCTVGGKPWIE